jgi:hypothetical protein
MSKRSPSSFKIKSFDAHKLSDLKKLLKFKKNHCNDQNYKDSMKCTKTFLSQTDPFILAREGPFDGYILAFDKDDVCGFLEWSYCAFNTRKKIDSIWLRVISTKAYGNREYYRGIGTLLIKKLFQIARKKDSINVQFIFISSSEAPAFYFKSGFKAVGATGAFVKKIRRWPTIQEIRMIQYLPLADPFNADLCKERIPFPYESDTMNSRWLRLYHSFHEAVENLKSSVPRNEIKWIEPFLTEKKYFLFYSKKEIQKLKRFPRSYYEVF